VMKKSYRWEKTASDSCWHLKSHFLTQDRHHHLSQETVLWWITTLSVSWKKLLIEWVSHFQKEILFFDWIPLLE
jgi:hypothetical protein